MKRALSLVAGGIVAFSTAWAIAETPPDAVSIEDGAVVAPVAAEPGDAARGKAILADRRKGNCLACHVNSDMADQPFHGNVGPSIDGAGSRWEEAQIRAIIVNPKQVFGEQTIMPAFYRPTEGLLRVREESVGKTILTAQEVEDVVAYLLTLKE